MAEDLQLPSRKQIQAWHLTEKQGLTDSQAAEILGIRRETVCRLRNAGRRRTNAMRATLAGIGCDCGFLDRVISGSI